VIESRPIQDRTQERLGANDSAIVASRLLLLRALRDVQEGRDPPHVFRQPPARPDAGIVVTHGEIPVSVDWRAYLRDQVSEVGSQGLSIHANR
jgi:hypothetical protein